MGRAFVVRLVTDPLAAGRVVGRVEAVDTGDEAVIASADELIAFITRPFAAAPRDAAAPRPKGRAATRHEDGERG